MRSVTRREVLSLGVAAGISVLLPRPLAAAHLRGAVSSNVLADSPASPSAVTASDLLAVTPEADSAVILNTLFPGLLSDADFQPLRPVAFLVSNVTGKDILAFTSNWTITTMCSKDKLTIRHYFRPHAGRENKTFFTGAVPAVRAGTTVLVTPFFNWSSNSYQNNNDKPVWTEILRRHPEIVVSELTKAPVNVTMRIVAAITNDYISVGPEDEDQRRHFVLREMRSTTKL